MARPFKNEKYLTLDNLSKYGHITLKFVLTICDLFNLFYNKETAISGCGHS